MTLARDKGAHFEAALYVDVLGPDNQRTGALLAGRAHCAGLGFLSLDEGFVAHLLEEIKDESYWDETSRGVSARTAIKWPV